MWGFLSNCVSAEADTIFRGAEDLRGIDAWRRLVRQVDHGRGIRREMLRREVQELHTRPIKSLEAIEEGVAVFENTMTENARVAGRESTNAELKSDLLRISVVRSERRCCGTRRTSGCHSSGSVTPS